MKTSVLFPVTLCVLLSACAKDATQVVGPQGQKRTLPVAKKFIEYQGTDVVVKGVTVKTSGVDAGVAEMNFSKKFRDVSSIAVVLDNAQYRDAQMLIANASALSDQDYNRKLVQISETQQKLDQLALIASVSDSAALQQWVAFYAPQAAADGQKPVTNTALGIRQF